MQIGAVIAFELVVLALLCVLPCEGRRKSKLEDPFGRGQLWDMDAWNYKVCGSHSNKDIPRWPGKDQEKGCDWRQRYIPNWEFKLNPDLSDRGVTERVKKSYEKKGQDQPGRAIAQEWSPKSRLTSGREAKDGQFPSFVEVISKTMRGKFHYCGGVILHKDIVMTAGQCVMHESVVVTVRAGVVDVNKLDKMQVRVARAICFAPGFDDVAVEGTIDGKEHRPRNDLALVWLKEDLLYDEYVQPACLDLRAFISGDEPYIAVGMGVSRENSTELSDTLKYHFVRLDSDKCHTQLNEAFNYKNNGTVEYNETTAGYPECGEVHSEEGNAQPFPCKGDSGAPVYTIDQCEDRGSTNKMFVAGVTSYKKNEQCNTKGNNLLRVASIRVNYVGFKDMNDLCFQRRTPNKTM